MTQFSAFTATVVSHFLKEKLHCQVTLFHHFLRLAILLFGAHVQYMYGCFLVSGNSVAFVANLCIIHNTITVPHSITLNHIMHYHILRLAPNNAYSGLVFMHPYLHVYCSICTCTMYMPGPNKRQCCLRVNYMYRLLFLIIGVSSRFQAHIDTSRCVPLNARKHLWWETHFNTHVWIVYKMNTWVFIRSNMVHVHALHTCHPASSAIHLTITKGSVSRT